jgi:hypothetical protein
MQFLSLSWGTQSFARLCGFFIAHYSNVTSTEILKLIEQWEQLKPTLLHRHGELTPDIPAEIRFIKRADSESSVASFALMAANPGGAAPVKMVRFNPVAANLLKTIGTRLSVAAHERELGTPGTDAVAADPVAATSRDWAAATLTIGKLKIIAAAASPDDGITANRDISEYQRAEGTLPRGPASPIINRLNVQHKALAPSPERLLEIVQSGGALVEAHRNLDRLMRGTLLSMAIIRMEKVLNPERVPLSDERHGCNKVLVGRYPHSQTMQLLAALRYVGTGLAGLIRELGIEAIATADPAKPLAIVNSPQPPASKCIGTMIETSIEQSNKVYDEAIFPPKFAEAIEQIAGIALQYLPKAVDAKPSQIPGITDPVTLFQAAIVAGISKRALEKRKKDDPQFPKPNKVGGRGKANYWNWPELLPYLRELSARPLPDKFPGNV